MQFTATVLALISIAAQEKMALKAKNLRHLRKHFMRFRLFDVFALLRHSFNRGTQREYTLKPL